MPRNIDAPLRNGTRTMDSLPQTPRNEIVVYQPDGEMRIEAYFDGETVWLPQTLIAKLFACSAENVRLHLKNIYASGELDKGATSKESLEGRQEGSMNVTRRFTYYNLDAIISIGYRVNSIIGVRFRQWATRVIKERMFLGAVQAAQLDAIDRRLATHDKNIAELKEKVDFFVRTQTPPLQGVFYDGQLWDARAFVDRLVKRAKQSLVLLGASLKDLGRKCFGFTKMDASEIPGLKVRM